MSRARLAGLCLIFTAGAWASSAADPAPSPTRDRPADGWPAMAGPSGDFQPAPFHGGIVDDLSEATVLWTSESRDLGAGKQGTPFWKSFTSGAEVVKYLGSGALTHPGSFAGVIVAGGKVFASSFRPAGPVAECDFPDGRAAMVRLDAEDVLVAMDFETGRTLWIAAEPGGILTGGGKRRGFQVSPVYSDGKVFSMGSTGRIFAYDAATGKKLWQADIGPEFARRDQERRDILSSLAKRSFRYPDEPGWQTSLIVADKTLVVPAFQGGTLRGLDVSNGQLLWEARGVGSDLVTPSVFRGSFVLTANEAGELRLLEAATGAERWKLGGLGPAFFTLSPSDDYVLVNANPDSGPKRPEGRVPGRIGAVRISPAEARLAWVLPDEPQNGLSCWMDTCARYQFTIRDGLAFCTTGPLENQAGRFLILNIADGSIVARHENSGGEQDRIEGLWYLVGDKVLCRADAVHGPTHGGRHPWILWQIDGSEIRRLPGSLDLNDFTNGYEVLMQTPIAGGRLLERSRNGSVLCYDLRKPAGAVRMVLKLEGAWAGLPPLEMKLLAVQGAAKSAALLYSDSAAAGLIYGSARRNALWENVDVSSLERSGSGWRGEIEAPFTTHQWKLHVDISTDGGAVHGRWTRIIPALEQPYQSSGAASGLAHSAERVFPTPWLKDQQWTRLGSNPVGTETWVIQLEHCLRKPDGKFADLTLSVDIREGAVVRAAAQATSFNQSWHEVSAAGLKASKDRLEGEAGIVINSDPWVKAGYAGLVTIDVRSDGSQVSGNYSASWGAPLETSGAISGSAR